MGNIFEIVEDCAASCRKNFACRRWRNPTSGPAEERNAKFFLELNHMRANGGLRAVQPLGREAKAAAFGDRKKGLNATDTKIGHRDRLIVQIIPFVKTTRVCCLRGKGGVDNARFVEVMTSIVLAPRRKRLQRSELAVPATSDQFFEKAAASDVDVIFFDLEDAIAPQRKVEARAATIRALNEIDWGSKTMAVRVNGLDTPWGYRDIVEVAEHCSRLDLILLPKAGGARDIEFVETLLCGIERAHPRPEPIGIEALIETALGMTNIESIARASGRLEALIFGVGDYIIDMQTSDLVVGAFNPAYAVLTNPDSAGHRSRFFGDQWHYALSRVASICRAYGIRPIDGPYTNFRDLEGFRASARRAQALGFEGKWAIHPSQVGIANEEFSPSSELVVWAERVTAAMAQANGEGRGAISMDGELIDMAHVKLATNIRERAELCGLSGASASRERATPGGNTA